MEGRVFVCSWKRIGDRYRVWWKARPKVAAEGDTFEEADEALWDAIVEATGDGENMHEYEPPAPSDAAGLRGDIDIVMVGGQEGGRLKGLDGLFVDGVCEECLHARGERTDAPLVVDTMQSGPRNCGSVYRFFARGATMTFASADFRAMLTAEEDASIEWREVVGPPRARKKFFEVIRGAVAIPYVAPRGIELSGWWCEACGHTTTPFVGSAKHKGPSWYVAASAFPSPLPSIFLLGDAPDWDIGFTRERWRALMASPGAKGCKSYTLGVLPDEMIDPVPVLPTFGEQNEKAAQIRREREEREAAYARSRPTSSNASESP